MPYVTPFSGNAVAFNGSTQYVTGTNYYNSLGGNFTIEFFMMAGPQTSAQGGLLLARNSNFPAENNNNYYIMCSHPNQGTYSSVPYILPTARQTIQIYNYNNNPTNQAVPGKPIFMGSTPVCDSKWHHIAIVRINGRVKVYIDGVLDTDPTNNFENTRTWDYSNFAIGSNPTDGTQTVASLAYNGMVSNLRIINGIGIYTDTFTPPTNELTTSQSSRTNVVEYTPTIPSPTGYSLAMNAVSGSYLTINNSPVLQLGTNDYTIEFWHFLTSRSASPIQTLFSNGTTSNVGCLVMAAGNIGVDTLKYQLSFNGNPTGIIAYIQMQSVSNVIYGRWTHIAVVRRSGIVYLYINGILDSTSGSGNYPVYGASWYIGNDISSYSSGFISNFRVVNGIAVYTGNFTVPTSALTTTQSSSTNISAITNTTVNNGGALTYQSTSMQYFSGNPTLNATTTNLTVEAWVNLLVMPTANTWTTNAVTIYSTNQNNLTTGIHFSLGTTNIFIVITNVLYGGYPHNMVPGTWYHLAYVISNRTVTFYVNGISVGSVSNIPITFAIPSFTIIGASNTSGTYSLTAGAALGSTGYISNLRVLKGTALYTGNFVPSTSPLTNTQSAVTNINAITGPSTSLLLQSSVTTDASTNAFTLTPGGSPSVNTSIYPNFVTTNAYSGYFQSNGITSQYASLQAPNTASVVGTGTFTVECWIYPIPFLAATSAYQIIMANDTSGGLAAFGINPTGTIFYGTSLVGILGTTSSLYRVNFNAWNHLALVRNVSSAASSVTIYVNGLAGFIGTNTTSYVAGIIRIGTDGAGTAFPYTGYISNLRIVNGVAVYTSDFSVPTAPLSITQSANTNGNPSSALAINTHAGNFNGTTQYLTVPNNATPLILGRNNFTIECWIYPTTATQSTWFIDFRPTTVQGAYPSLGLISGAVYYFTNSATRITGSIAPLYIWTHVALVRNNDITTLYINGSSNGIYTDTTSYLISLTSSPVIGTYGLTRGGTGFIGYISNTRVVNGLAVYTSTFTSPTTQITATQSAGTNISQIGTLTTTNGYYSNYFIGSAGQFLSLPGSSFVFGTNAFTIESWVYTLTLAPTFQVFVDNWIGTASFIVGQWTLFVTGTTGEVTFRYANSTTTQVDIKTTFGIPIGQWTHVAAVRTSTSANGFAIYINGLLAQTATLSIPIGINGSSTIGNSSARTLPWTGFISNVRLTNNVAVYTGAFIPQFTPLTNTQNAVPSTQSSLLALQTSNDTVDASTNAFTLTDIGSPTSSQLSPFPVTNGYSVYFSGASQYLNLASSGPMFNDKTIFTSDFTVEFWAYCMNSLTANNLFMAYSGPSDVTLFMGFNLAGQLSYGGYATFTTLSVAQTSVLFNTWTHIAYVRINGVETVYFNGVAVSTSTRILNFPPITTLYIGINAAVGASTVFTGYMSNFRVVHKLGVYTGNFTPSTTPLTVTQSSDTNIAAITGLAPANGGSLLFTGVMALSTTGNSQLAFGNSQYTVEFWFFLTSVTTQQCFYDLRGATTSNNASFMQILTNGTITYNVATTAIITSSSAVTTFAWYHVAVVRSGQSTNGVTMYINGINVGTGIDANTHSQFGLRLAQTGSLANIMVNGYLSNFRIIVDTALYLGTFIPSSSPLTAVTNTKILVLQNSVTADASLNNFTLSIATGSPSLFVMNTSISPFISATNVLIMQNLLTKDNSISNWTVTATNSPAFVGTPSPFTTTNGISTRFIGRNQYIQAPSNVAFTFGTGDFTIEGWIYINTNTTSGTLYDGRTSTNSVSPVIYIDSNIIYYAVGSTVVITGRYIVPATWYHIAVSRLSGNTSLFVNGVQTSNIYADSNNYVIGAPYIGTGLNSSNPLDGYISNVRVAKTAIYNNNFIQSNVPLTATVGGTINAISAITNTTGYFATAFSGSSQYLTIPNNTIFSLNGGSYTIELWAYWASLSGEQVILERFTAASGPGYTLYKTGGNQIQLYGSATVVTSTTAVVAARWYHIAIVYNGTNTRIFIDGTQEASTALNITDSASPLIIGSRSGSSTFFNGSISNLRITKGVAVYTGNFTVPTSPLTATQSSGTNISAITGTAVSLLTCQSATIIDNSTLVQLLLLRI